VPKKALFILFGTTTSGTPGDICVGVAGNIVDLPTVIKE